MRALRLLFLLDLSVGHRRATTPKQCLRGPRGAGPPGRQQLRAARRQVAPRPARRGGARAHGLQGQEGGQRTVRAAAARRRSHPPLSPAAQSAVATEAAAAAAPTHLQGSSDLRCRFPLNLRPFLPFLLPAHFVFQSSSAISSDSEPDPYSDPDSERGTTLPSTVASLSNSSSTAYALSGSIRFARGRK